VKTILTCSIDHDLKVLFLQRYRGRTSLMIEEFMKSQLGIDDDIDDKAILEDINKKREKLVQDKMRINLELKAIENFTEDKELKEKRQKEEENKLNIQSQEKSRINKELWDQLDRYDQIKIIQCLFRDKKINKDLDNINEQDYYVNYYLKKQ
jgi:hypothetical protein